MGGADPRARPGCVRSVPRSRGDVAGSVLGLEVGGADSRVRPGCVRSVPRARGDVVGSAFGGESGDGLKSFSGGASGC
jgi:hypothetical protein